MGETIVTVLASAKVIIYESRIIETLKLPHLEQNMKSMVLKFSS